MSTRSRREWRDQCEALLQTGGASAALDSARNWQAQHPDDPRPLLYFALAHLHEGRASAAEQDLLRLLESLPNNAAALRALSDALWQLERRDEALDTLRTCVERAPANEKARGKLYSRLRQAGRISDSMAVGQQWLADFPDSDRARKTVRYGASIAPLALSIMAALRSNDTARFERDLQDLQQLPASLLASKPKPLLRLVQALRRHRRFETALHFCRVYLDANGDDLEFLALQGNLFLRHGDLASAQTSLERAVRRYPDADATVWLDLSLAMLHSGAHTRGRMVLREAVGRKEEAASLLRLMGPVASLIPFFGAEIEDRLIAPRTYASGEY